jgi:parallel beta-helix repeat protein
LARVRAILLDTAIGKIIIGETYYSENMRICLLIILILIIGSVDAARVTVGPGNEDFHQIQKAIDNASYGDTIEVHSGIYQEKLYVSKALTLLGVDTGKGKPVVSAGGSGSAITLAASGSMIKGFNFTGSGHCGCGNAGILVESSNNTVLDNVIYRNKYGVFVRPGFSNNTFRSNDLLENEIAADDAGGNFWNGSEKAEGVQAFVELLTGEQLKGNHYSDYDEPREGCNDTNKDGICDLPRRITGGTSVDARPAISLQNH